MQIVEYEWMNKICIVNERFYARPAKGGLLQPPMIFNNFCLATEGCKTAICNIYLPYNASFHKYASKFGVSYGLGESSNFW